MQATALAKTGRRRNAQIQLVFIKDHAYQDLTFLPLRAKPYPYPPTPPVPQMLSHPTLSFFLSNADMISIPSKRDETQRQSVC